MSKLELPDSEHLSDRIRKLEAQLADALNDVDDCRREIEALTEAKGDLRDELYEANDRRLQAEAEAERFENECAEIPYLRRQIEDLTQKLIVARAGLTKRAMGLDGSLHQDFAQLIDGLVEFSDHAVDGHGNKLPLSALGELLRTAWDTPTETHKGC